MTTKAFPRITLLCAPLLAFAVSACQPVDEAAPQVSRADTDAKQMYTPHTADGACWSRDVFAYPFTAPDGTPRPVEVQIFETPCPEILTTEVLETLQRALQVRGYHAGPINGQMDEATRAAVHQFQRNQGIDSAVLTADTARGLGLIPHAIAPL